MYDDRRTYPHPQLHVAMCLVHMEPAPERYFIERTWNPVDKFAENIARKPNQRVLRRNYKCVTSAMPIMT